MGTKAGEEIENEQALLRQTTALRSSTMSKPQEPEEDFDLFAPQEFARALSSRIVRPFVFGPIEFSGLNSDDTFDGVASTNAIVEEMENKSMLSESNNGICVHGFSTQVKGRRLKRRTSLLKHGRFLQNLVVLPTFPEEPVPEVKDEEKDENEDDD